MSTIAAAATLTSEIIARYDALQVRTLRSDHDGAIRVTLGEDGINAVGWRKAANRYWYNN